MVVRGLVSEAVSEDTAVSEWISVKDRVPTVQGDYMVWIDGTGDTGDITPGVRVPFFFWGGKFREDVTHWQEIPAGPDEVKHGV